MRLGEILVRHNFVTAEQLEVGLTMQVNHGGRIGSNLIDLGYISVDTVARALGQQHSVPAASDDAFRSVHPSIAGAVPRDLCGRHGLFPLGMEATTLHVAMRDPQHLALLDQLGRLLNLSVRAYATPELRLHYYLEQVFRIPRPKRYQGVTLDADGWHGTSLPRPLPQPRPRQMAPQPAPGQPTRTGPFPAGGLAAQGRPGSGPIRPTSTGPFLAIGREPKGPPTGRYAARGRQPSGEHNPQDFGSGPVTGPIGAVLQRGSTSPGLPAAQPRGQTSGGLQRVPTAPPMAPPRAPSATRQGIPILGSDDFDIPLPPPVRSAAAPVARPAAPRPAGPDDLELVYLDEVAREPAKPTPPKPQPAAVPTAAPRVVAKAPPKPSLGGLDDLAELATAPQGEDINANFDDETNEFDLDIDVDMDFDDDVPTRRSGESISEVVFVSEVIAEIQRARDRETVISQLLRPVLRGTSLNVLLLPKGALANGLAALGTDMPNSQVRQLMVPLNAPSLLSEAHETRDVQRGPADAFQQMIANYLRAPAPAEACVVPITVSGKVINLLCCQSSSFLPQNAQEDLLRLAMQASTAYKRLILAKRRQG